MGFISNFQNKGCVDGGGGGFVKGLIRRKQVDAARSRSSSSSSSDCDSANQKHHPELAKALTVPHLIAIGTFLLNLLLFFIFFQIYKKSSFKDFLLVIWR